jgi:hypothetical protein
LGSKQCNTGVDLEEVVDHPGPRERDQLALARREQGAALTDLGVVALAIPGAD